MPGLHASILYPEGGAKQRWVDQFDIHIRKQLSTYYPPSFMKTQLYLDKHRFSEPRMPCNISIHNSHIVIITNVKMSTYIPPGPMPSPRPWAYSQRKYHFRPYASSPSLCSIARGNTLQTLCQYFNRRPGWTRALSLHPVAEMSTTR